MNFSEHRMLGRTGLTVSRLGVASGYKAPARSIEKAFHEHGVNYFFWSSPRSAEMEKALSVMARTEREKMVIAVQSYDHLGFMMRHFVEKGLKALGVDYADVLILGWFNRPPGGRVLDAALKLREEGKVRFLGMSGHNRRAFGELARQDESPIDVFMIRYNAVHRGAEQEIFPFLAEENRAGITTYTATCWRKLLKANKMPPGEKPLRPRDCYRFALSDPHVDLCLTGPKNGEEMEEALRALESPPLSGEEAARIRKIGDYIYGKPRM